MGSVAFLECWVASSIPGLARWLRDPVLCADPMPGLGIPYATGKKKEEEEEKKSSMVKKKKKVYMVLLHILKFDLFPGKKKKVEFITVPC